MWKKDKLGNWECTLTQDCTLGILNCILSNPKDIRNCIVDQKTCCTVQLGKKSGKNWIPKSECIKSY